MNENGNMLANLHNVFSRWENFFKQVLNLFGVRDVMQMVVHAAEPLVPEPGVVEVEIYIGKLIRCKSPGMDQIPVELIKAGYESLCSELHKLIPSISSNEDLSQQWKEFIIVPICEKVDGTD
jgi:hypothetical protein